MESLLRTRVAEFELKDAYKLAEIEAQVLEVRSQIPQRELTREDLAQFVEATDSVFLQYPKLCVKEKFSKLLYNGNPLQPQWFNSYQHTVLRVYDENQVFVGIYQWKEASRDIRPIKIFME